MKKYFIFIAIAIYVFLLIGCTTPISSKHTNTIKNTNQIDKPDKNDETDQIDEKFETYDVVVVGGEPEGVAAAVSAARNGSKTLLIERRDGLGGLMTYGMLNFLDVSNDQFGDIANAGIFKEWHTLVGDEIGFDIENAKTAFLKLVEDEENLTLILDTDISDIVMDGDALTAIKITDATENKTTIKAKRFIDATQDADLAVQAGAPYYLGGEDIGLKDKKMAVTLMIHLKNVNWDQIVAEQKSIFGGGEVHSNVGWGFSDLHYTYKPMNKNTRLRGLNIVRENDGSVIINALQIFGIDGLDAKSKQDAIETGKEETDYIVQYLQEHFPGFENAQVVEKPNELYVRETRHIKAEYQLPLSDVWENKDHWDSIGFGSYAVDVQATSPKDYGYVYGRPVQYAIPFRSLVPLKVDNLLVASKASGYSSLAAASARVIPTGMTAGQAAGVAAAVSIKENIDFRHMIYEADLIENIQSKLKEQGAKLYAFDIPYPYQDEWFYPKARVLLNYGLIIGGYDNTFPVDKPIFEKSFANLLSGGVKRVKSTKAAELKGNVSKLRKNIKKENQITRDQAAKLLLTVEGTKIFEKNIWNQAKAAGLIDDIIFTRINENRVLTGAEGYYIAGAFIEKIEGK